MSTATSPSADATLSNAQASGPIDFILQSFNMFDPNIAQDPSSLLNNLSNYLLAPLTDSDVNSQTTSQSFKSYYNKLESSQSSYTEFAASMGITGSYGFYSASVKASVNSQTYQAATYFNSSYNAVINRGTINFNKPSNAAAIRPFLQPQLCTALDGIANLSDAQAFTNTYGTHLVLGLNLGGCIQLKNEAQTTSYSSQLSMSQTLNAAYSGGVSISVAATAAEKFSSQFASSGLTESVYTSGGDSNLAAAIDPTDAKTMIDWANSCTSDTSYGITHAIEIAELAANNTAQSILREYIHLTILTQSINNPTIFTAATPLIGGTLTNMEVIANNATADLNAHFRIIGGGAHLDNDISSFLVSSYPQTNGSTSTVNSWSVSSHDIATPASNSNYLTGYAIAIFDPTYNAATGTEGLLQIQINTAQGTNPGVGGDQASATVDAGYLLAGGGLQSSITSGFQKFMMASYPSAANTWTSIHCDYAQAANNVTLTTYAIGIKSNHPSLLITPSQIWRNTSNNNHGNETTQIGQGMSLIGGGVLVNNTTGGLGNLVQQSFPSSANSWTEYNKDDMGEVTYADCTAYAFSLTASIQY